MYRYPVLQIINSAGKNIVPGLAGIWSSCSTTDKEGRESDSATIKCLGPPSLFGLPRKGEKFSIYMGWKDEVRPTLQGIFTVQKLNPYGDPEQGEYIDITLKAADFDKLKASGREHYDDTTFGDLMGKIAGKAGLSAVVDPALAAIKIPYAVRWDQSLIDFITQKGSEVGAVVKAAGDKLIAQKKGGASSASGKDLAPILIRRNPNYGYSIETDPRPDTGTVAASWIDPKTGKRKEAKEKTGRDGPVFTLPHPFPSEDEAKKAAKAEAYERGDDAASGWFEAPGQSDAFAGAKVNVSGFGWPVDGVWKAETVTKTVTCDQGFDMRVEVKAGSDDKTKKKSS